MQSLPGVIFQQAQLLPEGHVLSPKEFLHLGSRAAVDQAFSRLTKEGKLMRVARGIYVRPISSRFGSRAPSPEKVIRSLEKRNGEHIVLHGAQSANVLGLSQQVPIKEMYLTSGRTRKLKLGNGEILVKHAPQWMLALGGRPAGAAVRALAWMGAAHAKSSVASLRRTLPASEWNVLISARATLPSWMAQAIGNEARYA